MQAIRVLHGLLGLATVMIWGFNFVVIEWGLRDLSPILLLVLRFLFSAVPLAFFVPKPAVSWSLLAGFVLCQFVLQYSLLFVGMKLGMTAGLASIVLQLQSFFSVLIAIPLLGEQRPNGRCMLGILLGLSGIALVGLELGRTSTLAGFAMVVGAALSWAFGNIFIKRIGAINALELVVWGSLMAFPLLLLEVLLIDGKASIMAQFGRFTWATLGLVLFQAYPTTVFGVSVWSFLMRRYPMATIAPLALLVPIFGIIFSVFFLGEPMTWWKGSAGFLVVSGLVLSTGVCTVSLTSLSLASLGCRRKDASIKVGAITCSSGEAATLGVNTLKGYDLAIREWNAKGGVLGRQVRLIHTDSRSDPVESAVAMTKAIERDQVVAVLGPVLSMEALAAAPIAQRAGVPILVTASDPQVTAVGNCVFRVTLPNTLQARAVAKLAIGTLGATRAACIYDSGQSYSTGMAAYFKAEFQALGGTVVSFDAYQTGATDFHAQLTKAIRAQPQVLFVPNYYGDASLIARQVRSLGWSGQLLGTDAWDSPKLVELGATAVENAIFSTFFTSDGPDSQTRKFVAAFRAQFGEEPDCWAALGYDAGNILMEAIGKARSADRTSIREAVETLDYRGATGRITFRKDKDTAKGLAVVRIKNGKFTSMALIHSDDF